MPGTSKVANTAYHLVLLQRLAGTKSRQLWAKPPVVEMSHRVAPKALKAEDGHVHSSILHPDNGNHLAKQGVYEAFESPKERWGALAKALKVPKNIDRSDKPNPKPKSPLVAGSPTLHPSGSPTTLHPFVNIQTPSSPVLVSPVRSPARSRSGSMNGTPIPDRFILNPSVCDDSPITSTSPAEKVELIIPDHLQPQLKHMHPDVPKPHPKETAPKNSSSDQKNSSSDTKTTSKSVEGISITEMWDNADLAGMTRLTSSTSSTSQPPGTLTSTEFEEELEKKLDNLERQLNKTDTFSKASSSEDASSAGKTKDTVLSSSSSAGVSSTSVPSQSSITEEKLEALDVGQSDHFSNSSSEQASVVSIKAADNRLEVPTNSLLLQAKAKQHSFELEEVGTIM